MTHLMKSRHYFIKNYKADELSDNDMAFVYQCYFLDKEKYPSPVEQSVYSKPCFKRLDEPSELIPNSRPILMILRWYQSYKRQRKKHNPNMFVLNIKKAIPMSIFLLHTSPKKGFHLSLLPHSSSYSPSSLCRFPLQICHFSSNPELGPSNTFQVLLAEVHFKAV